MNKSEIKACPFCGEPAGVEIKTANEKEYYAIGCKNLVCRGSAWAGDPDAVRALARWNERAGDRQPATSKGSEPSTLASAMCSAAAVERAIDALKYRVKEIQSTINQQPSYIAKLLDEGMKNDTLAIEALEAALRQNEKMTDCREENSR